MNVVEKATVGVIVSAGASLVWTALPNSNTFSLSANPLAFMEHTHWGLLSLLVGKYIYKCSNKFCAKLKDSAPYWYGFGAGLIAIEATSSQPFGIGKPSELAVPNVALASALLWLLAY